MITVTVNTRMAAWMSAVPFTCAVKKKGISISVNKPHSDGQLLDAKQSPFGKALNAVPVHTLLP